MQTKVNFKLFHFVQIETTHKPSKVALAKTFFSSEYVTDVTWFSAGLLFYVITVKHYFL